MGHNRPDSIPDTIMSDALLTVTAQVEASKLLFLFMKNANGCP